MSPDTYIVTSNADDGSTGTLRAAIMYANANPGTTISFDSMLTGATVTLTSELPLILGDQTIIDGSGAMSTSASRPPISSCTIWKATDGNTGLPSVPASSAGPACSPP